MRISNPAKTNSMDGPIQPLVNRSGVSGSGLWRIWQRSFEQEANALLDLLDNAIDANRGHGRIRINSTASHTENENEGILMLNSFPEASYKDMAKILQVFESEKDTVDIGENGVGTKHASASLSNFSVVATKCDTKYQVGFLCTSIHTPERLELPSYTFESASLQHEIESYCSSDKTFRLCLQYFGGSCVPSLPPNRNKETKELDYDVYQEPTDHTMLQKGKERLFALLRLMSNPSEGWSSEYCVFALWLDQVRTQESSSELLDMLIEELPKKYLHLRREECDILINGKQPKFQYWERRLLHLTCFSVKVSKTHRLSLQPDQPSENTNQIHIFVGFDPIRPQQACLYMHTRETGRLVKHIADCRKYLELNSSGTEFSQGLTIILDDPESSLPLTPTKQGIAWSDGKNGNAHKENVKAWLRASAKTFYDHILNLFGGKCAKGVLSKEVRRHYGTANEWIQNSEASIIPLSENKSFNKLVGCHWKLSGGNLINRNKKVSVKQGDATIMQMNIPTTNEDESPTKKPKRKRDLVGVGADLQKKKAQLTNPLSHHRTEPSTGSTHSSFFFHGGKNILNQVECRMQHMKKEIEGKDDEIQELKKQLIASKLQTQKLSKQLQLLEGQAESDQQIILNNQHLEREVARLRQQTYLLQQQAQPHTKIQSLEQQVADLRTQNNLLMEENERIILDSFSFH